MAKISISFSCCQCFLSIKYIKVVQNFIWRSESVHIFNFPIIYLIDQYIIICLPFILTIPETAMVWVVVALSATCHWSRLWNPCNIHIRQWSASNQSRASWHLCFVFIQSEFCWHYMSSVPVFLLAQNGGALITWASLPVTRRLGWRSTLGIYSHDICLYNIISLYLGSATYRLRQTYIAITQYTECPTWS
jgi:hypothetical protein